MRGLLAGTSAKRHPAAARSRPKSMSSQKHSAGKLVLNQMGFVLLLSTQFHAKLRETLNLLTDFNAPMSCPKDLYEVCFLILLCQIGSLSINFLCKHSSSDFLV